MNIILGSVAGSINVSTGVVFDSDALTYIQAVEVADNQVLESPVKIAINTLVVGLKTDGIWSDISACGILAGARTLNGALVPLKGPQPTNFNFVAEDYSRSLGLSGDGLTKYIDTNEPNNNRSAGSSHISVYISKRTVMNSSGFKVIAGTFSTSTSAQDFLYTNNSVTVSGNIVMGIRRGFAQLGTTSFTGGNSVGFKGGSRTSSNNTDFRINNISTISTLTTASGNIRPESQYLYAIRTGTSPFAPQNFTNAGLTFYSIGSATNLERLDNRVTTFMQTLSTII